MRTSSFLGPREIRIEEVPDPSPGPGEAVVRVRAAGICGGDLHEWRARRQLYATPYPRPAQGHELAGEVDELGSGVEGLRVGDRVAVQPMISCLACRECLAGRFSLCRRLAHIGVARPGGFAERCVAPAANLFVLPVGVSFDEAALIDCVAVAVHALRRVPVERGEVVTVLGAGAIGLGVAQLVRAAGARVTLVATRPRPLEVARALGIERVVDLSRGDAPSPDADVVFETAGGGDLLDRAVAAARPGARIGLVGEAFGGQLFDVAAAMAAELTVSFVWSHDGRGEFEEAIRRVAAGDVALAPAITHRYPLPELEQAFHTASDRAVSDAIKVVVTP